MAIASHGSAWLRSPDGAAVPQLSTNSTFRYVANVEFSSEPRADGVDLVRWLTSLRARGYRRLWLAQPAVPPVRNRWPYLEPHMEVAFANGGHWFALATGGSPTEAWRASWTVIEPRPADNRIWAVRYEGTPATDLAPQQLPLADARSALDATLAGARDFAKEAGLPEWAATLTEALETDNDRPPFQPDLMSPDFPDDSRRLIAKASRAWVFGGMGSWNDLGFESDATRAEHAEVSRLLFATLLQACVAAVNCPLPDRSPGD